MRISLGTKIATAILGVLAISFVSSAITIRSAFHFETLQHTVIADNLASVLAAEELEIALLMQRGNVASFMLDNGNTDWLNRLIEYEEQFDKWISQARTTARSEGERVVLKELERVHANYVSSRQAAVKLFTEGHADQAKVVLLNDVSREYQHAYDLCERFIELNQKQVKENSDNVRSQVERTTVIAMNAVNNSCICW